MKDEPVPKPNSPADRMGWMKGQIKILGDIVALQTMKLTGNF